MFGRAGVIGQRQPFPARPHRHQTDRYVLDRVNTKVIQLDGQVLNDRHEISDQVIASYIDPHISISEYIS